MSCDFPVVLVAHRADALAALTALIGMPIALMLIGKAKETAARASDDIEYEPTNIPDVALRDALKRGRFWLLILAIVCINIPGSGVLGQLAPLVSDAGLGDGEVAIVMSIYAAGLLLGRVTPGIRLIAFRRNGWVRLQRRCRQLALCC